MVEAVKEKNQRDSSNGESTRHHSLLRVPPKLPLVTIQHLSPKKAS